MVAPSHTLPLDDADIGGDLFTEQDLADVDDLSVLAADGRDPEWVLGELWKDLYRGEHARAVLAEAEQRRIIEAFRGMEHQHIEGIGRLRARIPLDVYLHWTARYGPDFWKQEDTLQFFAARNPGFLVENFRLKTTVTVDDKLPAALVGAPASESGNGVNSAAGVRAPAALPARRVRGRGRWAS